MTTASWSSRVRHDTDATYQEWRDEFITKLGVMVAAGKLAADETNITPGAGARPGTNTEQGYAVYHIADSLHGTAPIYIRFGFGTAAGTTSPRMQATTGTSTNGSGVLGGTALSTIADFGISAAQTTDTARQSYLCVNAGFLGIDWKVGSGSNHAFWICRTCDSDGAPTVTGSMAHWGAGNSAAITKRQAFRYASAAAAYTAQTAITNAALGIYPQTPANSAVGSDIQVYLGWTISPRVTPLFAVCGVFVSELVAGGTFTATLVGASARTFLTMNTQAGPYGPVSGAVVMAMLWE